MLDMKQMQINSTDISLLESFKAKSGRRLSVGRLSDNYNLRVELDKARKLKDKLTRENESLVSLIKERATLSTMNGLTSTSLFNVYDSNQDSVLKHDSHRDELQIRVAIDENRSSYAQLEDFKAITKRAENGESSGIEVSGVEYSQKTTRRSESDNVEPQVVSPKQEVSNRLVTMIKAHKAEILSFSELNAAPQIVEKSQNWKMRNLLRRAKEIDEF